MDRHDEALDRFTPVEGFLASLHHRPGWLGPWDSGRMGNDCGECGGRRASKVSPTGCPLCDACFARLTGFAAAGGAIASGADVGAAVGSAIAAAGYSSAMDRESQHRAEQARKLAEARGFWRRVKIRIIG